MSLFRPYSSRLSRGTLLLIHSSALRLRYDRLRRGIAIDTAGLLAGSALVMIAGWLAAVIVVSVSGAALALAGVIMWAARIAQLRYRERRTPTMVFIGEEGISAIMPDSSSLKLSWPEVSAHEARFRPSIFTQYDTIYQREETRGLLLQGGAGRRIYLTHDLDGFADLLEVLAELDVPLSSLHSRINGIGMRRQDALERRAW